MMYVAIHEMAHIGCHEIGHTDLPLFIMFLKKTPGLFLRNITNDNKNDQCFQNQEKCMTSQ